MINDSETLGKGHSCFSHLGGAFPPLFNVMRAHSFPLCGGCGCGRKESPMLSHSVSKLATKQPEPAARWMGGSKTQRETLVDDGRLFGDGPA